MLLHLTGREESRVGSWSDAEAAPSSTTHGVAVEQDDWYWELAKEFCEIDVARMPVDKVDGVDRVDKVDGVDKVDTADTVDTVDTVDTADT
eukprot:883176-Rhodomonas_salina.3